MLRVDWNAKLLFAAAAIAAAHPTIASGQASSATTGQIQISYEPPKDAQLQPIYQELRQRQVLERLQGFMAPLRLPRQLAIRTTECGAESVAYKSGDPVTICYEMVKHINDIASQKPQDANQQALIKNGTFVEATLHQLAYGIFDQLQVPILGREDDAADRIAALVMMQFGDKVAYTTIVGTGMFFELSNHTWTGADFAAEQSPEAQRFYNYLCIAYGGDPITFQFLAPQPGPSDFPRLPEDRAPRCIDEYLQVAHAFDLRIMPYIDPNLLIKVRAAQWLQSDEVAASIK